MPNNVASAREIVLNGLYRIFVWTGAWAFTFRDVLPIPLAIVILRVLLQTFVPRTTSKLLNTVVIGTITRISQDIVELGVFATLMVLFIKLSIILKNDLQTVWNIWTPRYEEYSSQTVKKSYNEKSLFTEGYISDSKVIAAELIIMKRQSNKFFVLSAFVYVIIQSLFWLLGKNAIVLPLEEFLTNSVSSRLLFVIIGLPILFANVVHGLHFSIYPTAETALFFIEIGIPSILFIFGLRNRISHYKYIRMNRAIEEEESIFRNDVLQMFGFGFHLLMGLVIFGTVVFIFGRLFHGLVAAFVVTLLSISLYMSYLFLMDKLIEVLKTFIGFDGRTDVWVPGLNDGLALSPDVDGFDEITVEPVQTQKKLARLDRLNDFRYWLIREGGEIGPTESVDLQEAVEDVWKSLAEREPVTELVYRDDSLGRVTADYDRLYYLLENLLENAIIHGESDVIVRIERIQDGFAVVDDAPGIPESIREQVFEKGYSTAEGRRGLGLYVVKQVAEAHGWEVDLGDSATGGTRVEITGIDTSAGDES